MPEEDELFEETGETADDLLGEVSDSEEDPLGSFAEAADYARNEEAARPTQMGGGVPLQKPFEERGFLQQLSESISDSPVAKFARNTVENAASAFTSQGSDELQSSLIGLLDQDTLGAMANTVEGAQPITEPAESTAREYAAGSRFEDNRRTLEAERAERDAESPGGAFVGQVAGGVLQGAAMPYAKAASASKLLGPVATNAGTAAAQLGANLVGSGSGDVGERVEQAANWVEEHPVLSSVGVAAPAAVTVAGPVARELAKKARQNQYANRAAAVTTPAQRTAIAENRGGQEAIYKLGQDIEEQGLHKQPWYLSWLPPNAKTYYENASKARIAANEAMQGAEQQIVARGNPEIPVAGIADQLDQSADDVSRMTDRSAAEAEAAFRRDQAAGIRKATEVQPLGPPVRVKESALPEWFESTAFQGPAAPPKTKMPDPVQLSSMPFDEALKNRRFYDSNINHSARGGYEGAGMQEQVRRQIVHQLRGNIEEGLDAAGAAGQVDTGLIDAWKEAKKRYSVAATVEDPALAKMQGDYGGNLNLRDMAAAQIAGISGPLAVAGAGLIKGRGPSVAASNWRRSAEILETAASASSPNLTASAVRAKNDELKQEVQEAQQNGNNWHEDFLGVY